MKEKRRFENDSEGFSGSESLDEYIRVSRPGTMIVLLALLVVLAALIVWGLIGKLPVTLTVKGLVVNQKEGDAFNQLQDEMDGVVVDLDKDNLIYCFVDASRYNVMQLENFGERAEVEMPDGRRFYGSIYSQLEIPLDTEDCKKILFENEWVTERCVTTDYSWWVIVEPDTDISEYEFMLSDVTFVAEEVAPITFISR